MSGVNRAGTEPDEGVTALNLVTGGLGAVLVRACGVGPGQRVLDVAAGTGNTAIPAAERERQSWRRI